MVDLVTAVVAATSAFFVALSFGLLLRYRQVSQRINASSDMARDLWSALEQRLKKQDERILDMMGRLEVIQARSSEAPDRLRAQTASKAPVIEEKPIVTQEMHVTPVQPTSRVTTQVTLDETELSVIRLLGVKPRSSVEVKELTGKSREHAARLMKKLFDGGLVTRDSSKKPFVYQLTAEGRLHLP